jgi:lipoyl(octanoyl) transferase
VPVVSPDLESQISAEPIAIQRLGTRDYDQVLTLQRKIHLDVTKEISGNTLLILEHPSVYTAGRRTLDSEKPTDGTPVIDVDRGGKITWHGIGQLVGYPIVRLANPHELVGFVREIEAGLIEVCDYFGIASKRIVGRSGVWVEDARGARKIAAIGIRVASGVTMHGCALNINPDLSAFAKIIPCGINDAEVTSMAKELSRDITIAEVQPVIEDILCQHLMKVSA